MLGGDGTLMLYKYRYPDQRVVKDADGREMGVAGAMDLLNRWNELKNKALTKDARMVQVKKQFADVTAKTVIEFAQRAKEVLSA